MNETTDWFEVERIADGCYQITEGDPVLPCHSIVFRDGDEAVLVDTGLGIGDLRAVAEDLAGTEVPVLLTHAHWDHLGAAHQFDDVSIDDRERGPGGRVAIDVLSDEFTERPGQFVRSYLDQGREFPDGFDPDSYAIEPIEGAAALAPWDEVAVGDRTLELVPIPGHSPGQLAVLDRVSGVCHGADVLEPGGEIFAHFRHSDVDEYRDTIDRLVDLREEGAFDTLTTGHGEPLRGDDLSVLDDVAVALERVADDDAPYEIVDTNWGPSRKYSIAGVTVLTVDR
jgi:glyoxylase-like metal-dependent hydrolase (beta-lactamase superfamily II)